MFGAGLVAAAAVAAATESMLWPGLMQGFPCWCLWCRAFVVVVAWIGGLFVTAVVAADSSCWRDIGLY